jgi:hypothetical protein
VPCPSPRRLAATLATAALAALLVPAAAGAHGLVGKTDLPIPEGWFAVAAAVVLVVSFLGLAGLWSRPRLQTWTATPLLAVPKALDVVPGALGLVVFLAAAYAGLAGTESQRDNLAPTAVYVLFWVGVPFASLLFGDVWRVLSPWRALGRATGWVAKRVLGDGMPAPMPYPERLGRWPAAAGIIGFGICELCWATATEPQPAALIMLLYAVAMLVGMSVYGVEAWTRNADAFGVYFSLFASIAPLAGRARRYVARWPMVGANRIELGHGSLAVLLAGIGITAFDGAQQGPLFNDVVPDLQSFFRSLGFGQATALELGFVLGLLVAVLVVSAIWGLGVWAMPPAPGGDGTARPGVGASMAHALIPILCAYVVAHYFSLLVYNGQDLWRLASDPLGRGSDLFGGASSSIDYSVIGIDGIWYVQVIALVIGHVAALVLAHDRALTLYGSHRAATRSQIVMLVLMVAFTCLGLWLLSAANG